MKINDGDFKTNCGYYLCASIKILSLIDNKELYSHYKCPKCDIETKLEYEDNEMVMKLQTLNVLSYGICYERNGELDSYHDNYGLRVCKDCHFIVLTKSNLCPYCRKQIY